MKLPGLFIANFLSLHTKCIKLGYSFAQFLQHSICTSFLFKFSTCEFSHDRCRPQVVSTLSRFACHEQRLSVDTVADLHTKVSGARPPPPIGLNSFVFTYVFTEKHLCWRLAPPPMRVGAPQWEILDPPLGHIYKPC